VAGVLGALVPALLGVLVYFNVLYVEAEGELGTDPVPSEGGWHRSAVALAREWDWNPLRRTAGLVPAAVADVLGHGDPRPPYSSDPRTHYGFYALEPRLDLWWLWVEPARGSRATYLLAVPIAASAAAGAALVRAARRAPAGDGDGAPVSAGAAPRRGAAAPRRSARDGSPARAGAPPSPSARAWRGRAPGAA